MPETEALLNRRRPEKYDKAWGLGTLTHNLAYNPPVRTGRAGRAIGPSPLALLRRPWATHRAWLCALPSPHATPRIGGIDSGVAG